MRYRKLFYDGGNGARMGDIVDEETAFRESAGSRNGDGLLENDQSDVLYVPLDEGFQTNPICQNEGGEDDDLDEEDDEEDDEEGDEQPHGVFRP